MHHHDVGGILIAGVQTWCLLQWLRRLDDTVPILSVEQPSSEVGSRCVIDAPMQRTIFGAFLRAKSATTGTRRQGLHKR